MILYTQCLDWPHDLITKSSAHKDDITVPCDATKSITSGETFRKVHWRWSSIFTTHTDENYLSPKRSQPLELGFSIPLSTNCIELMGYPGDGFHSCLDGRVTQTPI